MILPTVASPIECSTTKYPGETLSHPTAKKVIGVIRGYHPW
jgi:hypothetical protein